MVGFRDLVGVAYVPVSKNVAVKAALVLQQWSIGPGLSKYFSERIS